MRTPARRRRAFVGAAVLVGAVGLASGAQAQAVETAPPPPHAGLPVADEASTLEGPPRAARRAFAPPPACPPDEVRAQFEVTYEGFPPEARAAFQAAVDTWACRIDSPFPIRLAARWQTLARSTLGTAGPFLHRNFRGAPVEGVWYPAPLADLYAGRDLAPDRADIEATFNAEFEGWHFDIDAPPPERTYDLYTVVLHEIGHGLGMIGGFDVEDGRGTLEKDEGASGPYLYDRFTVDEAGRSLVRSPLYPEGSTALGDVLREATFFSGPAVEKVFGADAPLAAPPTWISGGSYSHLDEDVFPENEPDGLMTPFLRQQETIAEPGTVTCALLADLGWLLAGDCADRVGPVPGTAGRLLVFRDGPNPFRTGTRLRVVGPPDAAVEAALYDTRGRRVRPLDVSAAGELAIDGAGLAAGVYVVRLRAGEAETAVTLAVVR